MNLTPEEEEALRPVYGEQLDRKPDESELAEWEPQEGFSSRNTQSEGEA